MNEFFNLFTKPLFRMFCPLWGSTVLTNRFVPVIESLCPNSWKDTFFPTLGKDPRRSGNKSFSTCSCYSLFLYVFPETSNVYHERNKDMYCLPELTSLIRFGHFICNLLALSLLVLIEFQFLSLFDKLVLVIS